MIMKNNSTGIMPKNISIEGAPKIGEGAHGEVYRISEDTIVKVYRSFVSMDMIKREKELSRWAFVNQIPTAISFNIVEVGDRYGVVYEILNARSAADYVNESEANLEDFTVKSVELMNKIHAIDVEPGKLPDMKEMTLSWVDICRKYLPSEICDKLKSYVQAVPDSNKLLHADFHLGNIMVSDGELMLIDMDTLCTGDPIFEMATIYNSYMEFVSIDEQAAAFLGIDVPTAHSIWDKTLKLYTDCDRNAMNEIIIKARLLGCIRIIGFMDKQERPESEICINACVRDIKALIRDCIQEGKTQ